MTDLGTLGGTDSLASAINASGTVVGISWTLGNTSRHAFLYSGGTMTDLGTLGGDFGFAQGINDSGQVVGESYTSDGYTHPFLYSDGVMTDLNTEIPYSSGWELGWAFAINDAGQIVGQGIHNGQYDAFLLTPQIATAPEPGFWVPLLACLGCIAVWKLRKNTV